MAGDERSRAREREAVTDRSRVRSLAAFGLLISERFVTRSLPLAVLTSFGLVKGTRVPIRAEGRAEGRAGA